MYSGARRLADPARAAATALAAVFTDAGRAADRLPVEFFALAAGDFVADFPARALRVGAFGAPAIFLLAFTVDLTPFFAGFALVGFAAAFFEALLATCATFANLVALVALFFAAVGFATFPRDPFAVPGVARTPCFAGLPAGLRFRDVAIVAFLVSSLALRSRSLQPGPDGLK